MKKIMILLLSILTLAAATGCGDKNDTSEPEPSSLQSTENDDVSESTEGSSESISSVITETGTFDWDTAMSQTTLEGRKVPMPFCMDDLGEYYELTAVVNQFFGGSGCTSGLKNVASDTYLGSVQFENVSAEEYTDDCKITYADIDDLSIQGIQEGISMEYVYDTWGEPHKSDDVAIYYFNQEQDKMISIYIDEENKIQFMNVDFMLEKEGN